MITYFSHDRDNASRLFCQAIDASLRDLGVLLRHHTRDADGADDLAVDDERKPALQRARPWQAKEAEVGTSTRNRVLEDLCRPAEGRC
jgi:hypothetical protein